MIPSNKLLRTAFLFTLVASVCLLYVPFLNNKLVFDDKNLIGNDLILNYALTPLDLRARTFPYFTLAFVALVSNGCIAANRIFNVLLHLACVFSLYQLLRVVLIEAWKTANSRFADLQCENLVMLAGAAALWFALSPIAVYGVAYLAQRTIVFATLFSLLSLWFYCRACAGNRARDIFAAAFFYSLAVFCKEHAIMLPFAGVMLTALFDGSWRMHWKRIVLYVGLCTPAALTVVFAKRHLVGAGYEPNVAGMVAHMSPISVMAYPWGKWVVSAVVQTELFFGYIASWFVPDVHILSADMRFDFERIWFAWWSFPVALLFFLSPVVALYFLRRKGLVALFCCGFLYAWILFLTEIVAVRFQEPFVLYRSYLWAPGYLIMLVAICAHIPRRWLILTAIPLLIACFLLARDRLESFQDEAHLWKDAAAKLSSPTLLGSDRIFYNRGRAYLQEKRYIEAQADFSRTIELSPQVYQAYYNRALAFYAQEKYPQALADLDHALLMSPKNAAIPFVRGLIFEYSGCSAAALGAYTASSEMGNQVAKLKVQRWTQRKDFGEYRRPIANAVQCPV
jgi:tetratricopeptide (TPR) repeat protein